jgi:predicted metal-binding protein
MGFPVCEEEQTVNEWGTNKRMKTTDGRLLSDRLSSLSRENRVDSQLIVFVVSFLQVC